jgi:hypothetical protein
VSSSSRSVASRSRRVRSAAASVRRARPCDGCWRPGSDLPASVATTWNSSAGVGRPRSPWSGRNGLDHGDRVAAAGARRTGRDVLTRAGLRKEGRARGRMTRAYRICRNRIVSP